MLLFCLTEFYLGNKEVQRNDIQYKAYYKEQHILQLNSISGQDRIHHIAVIIARENPLYFRNKGNKPAFRSEACEGHNGQSCQNNDRKSHCINEFRIQSHTKYKADNAEVNPHDGQ